jgi:hypothetical protein
MSTGYWTYDKGQRKGKGKGKDSDDTEEKGNGNGKGSDRASGTRQLLASWRYEGTDFQGKQQLLAPWRYEANIWSL